jgi:hypothetical protein
LEKKWHEKTAVLIYDKFCNFEFSVALEMQFQEKIFDNKKKIDYDE